MEEKGRARRFRGWDHCVEFAKKLDPKAINRLADEQQEREDNVTKPEEK